jgi:ATP-dependent Clp protease protease subunit
MREAMRVIEGSAKPGEAFWTIRNAKDADAVELEFFGPISEYSWLGDEVTPAAFKKELYEKGNGRPVTMLVNSPGGEVIAASVIRSILQEYPGQVTADIVGMAASAATIVVTGADHVRMRESALMMIHDPSAFAYGTIDELEQVVELLKTVKIGIIDGYETKTKMDRGKLAKLMKDETWMTAHQALEMGFVDEVVTGTIVKAPKAMRAGFLNCLKGYENSPSDLMDVISEDEIEGDAPGAPGAEEVIAVEEPTGEGETADNKGTSGPAGAQELRERVKSILKEKK